MLRAQKSVRAQRSSVCKMVATSVILFLTTAAFAARSETQKSPFGIGLVLVNPTGLSANYRLSPRNAIDAAVGWNFGYYVEGHTDYLFKTKMLYREGTVLLTAHYGLGIRIRHVTESKSKREDSANAHQDRIGPRFPVGVDVWFPTSSLEIFSELAGVLDLAPKSDFSIEFAAGVRFYF